jgi:HK97 family phage major capsid protein
MEKYQEGQDVNGSPLTKEQAEALNKVQTVVTEATANMISKETADQQLKELKESLTTKFESTIEDLTSKLVHVGTELSHVKRNVGNGSIEVPKTFAEQMKEQIEKSPEQWEAFKTRKSNAFQWVLKASANMTTSNINSTTNVVSTGIEPGLIGILDDEDFIMRYCDVGRTNNAIISYTEKRNRDGSTVFIAEAAAKNKIDFDIVKTESNARKVADYITVSEEMLTDVDFMAAEIRNELVYQVMKAANAGILSGDGNAPNLSGLTTIAPPYSLTTVLTTTPNNYDCLAAMAAQIRTNNGKATHVFINPIDAANLKISKGTTGYYVVVNGELVSLPYMVIENNQIPVGFLLMGDMRKSKVRILEDIRVESAWNSDDFVKNNVTVRGEMRLHHYVPVNHRPAFVYDAIADILTAITA